MKEVLIFSGIFLLAVDAIYNRLDLQDLKSEVNYLNMRHRLLQRQVNDIKKLEKPKNEITKLEKPNYENINTKSPFVELATFD